MKNNILKHVKKSLSIILALALLAISLFTDVSINTKAAETEKNIIYWSGNKTAPDESNKDANGNIIISTAEELNYIATTASSGKSYKIADGIDVIILQPESSVDAETLMGLADYEAVKTYLTETITATAWCNYSSDPPQFNSSFDGNGVEIYGFYGTGTNVGLFPGIDGGTVYTTDGHTGNTFQNFAFRNSYLESSRRVGVIGAYCATGVGTGTVNVKNCEVSNCYIVNPTTTASYFGEMGVLVGRTLSKEIVHIENCLVYGNYNYATGLDKQIPLYSGAYSSDSNAVSTVENSIVLGTVPYPVYSTSSVTHSVNSFENVYTDQDLPTYTTYADTDIKKIDANAILGSAAKTVMPGLDWNKAWVTVDSDYPALRAFGESSSEGDDQEDTDIGTTDTWDGTYLEPQTTDTAGNIIITSAEELAWVVLMSGAAGAGKTYKVQNGITAFYINENTAELTLSQVKNKLDGNNTNVWEYQGNYFQGTLDGNGVAVYGLYSKGENNTASSVSAFIPYITGSVAVKNIAIKNSYIAGYKYSAALIGSSDENAALASLTIENCEVSNNYIYQTRTSSSTSGLNYSASAMCGLINARQVPCYITINNCAIYENELYSAMGGNISGTIAYFNPKSDNANNLCFKFSNLLVSGVAPWCGNHSYHGRNKINFSNVYTDTDASNFVEGTGNVSGSIKDAPCEFVEDKITFVDTVNMQGTAAQTNMSALDWEKVWALNDTTFPSLVVFNSNADGGDQGGSEGGDQGGNEGETPETVTDCAQNIIYWDNTKTDSTLADSGEKGTADDPIIIDSAEELNYLALRTNPTASTGKHYKMADGIDAVILQPKDTVDAMGGAAKIMNIASGSAVNTYFNNMKAAGHTPANWISTPNSTQFNGSFDGNGVKIYGLYSSVASSSEYNGESVGLFPVIDGGGTTEIADVEVDFIGVYYKNIAIRNSYFASYRRVGALTGIAFGTNYGAKVQGTINIDTVEVSNCYMRATATADGENGVLAGSFVSELTNISNCLVYGNDTLWNKNGTTTTLTLIGSSGSIMSGENEVKENTLKDSIILGTKPQPQNAVDNFNYAKNVENIYTDQDISALVTKYGYTDEDMMRLTGTTAEAIGTQIGTGLNRTGRWITVQGGMPTLLPFHNDIEILSSDNTTHSFKCSCGIEGGVVSHIYDDDYKCVQCNYQHIHSIVDAGIESDADCVIGGIMNTKCESCDYTSTREITSEGHQFSAVVPATAGDCCTEATVAYKTCSVCGLNFDKDAGIHSDEPLEDIRTGYTGRHNWIEQAALASECSGVESIPYFKCSVCDTYLVEGVMTETKPSEIDGHTASGNYYIDENTHANICVTCGDTFSEQVHTDANSDSICDICGWPCGEHVFEGASITLTDSIAVNYMIKKSVVDVLGYDELAINFTFRGKDYTVSEYTENGEYYVFTFDKIAPHRITDIIYATLCGTKDGVSYTSLTSEYSVERYCYNMLEKYSDDEQLRTLLVDLLNYGAEAQIYTDYNTDNLANADLTAAQKAWETSGDVTTESVQNLKYKVIDNPTVKWKGAGLYLDEAATLRFTIQTDSVENLVVKATCGTTTFEVSASEFVKRSGTEDMYYVYIRGVNVTQMRESVYLTVLNGETEVSNTICYSVESYANAQIGGSDTALSKLLVAMIKYGDSAKAYHDAQ